MTPDWSPDKLDPDRFNPDWAVYPAVFPLPEPDKIDEAPDPDPEPEPYLEAETFPPTPCPVFDELILES